MEKEEGGGLNRLDVSEQQHQLHHGHISNVSLIYFFQNPNVKIQFIVLDMPSI